MQTEIRKTRVIAIDGPAGAGKSTVAREVAKKINFVYLDTGAMYRALTLKALLKKIKLDDEEALVNLANSTEIEIESLSDGKLKVILDNEDVTNSIRANEVTNNVSCLARVSRLREVMVNLQRRFAENNNVVVEGRDIGTVVFPDAEKKIYLDANFNERAKRRFKELNESVINLSAEAVTKDLFERDTQDLTRKVAPLKKAEDAVSIDTTNLSIEEVVERVLKIING